MLKAKSLASGSASILMGIGMNAMIVRLGLIYGELSSLDNVPTMFGR